MAIEGKCILVIEDNKDVRENIVELLDLTGYKVLSAENGRKGSDLAIKNTPDLIICDIMMPELDGYGVMKVLSGRPETSHIPLVFLTAKTDKSDYRKGMNLGASDYILKPYDDLELLQAIETRLKLAESKILPLNHHSFADAQTEAWKRINSLAQDSEVRSFKKKEMVFQEGSTIHHLCVLEKGMGKKFRLHQSGKELVLKFFNAPALINLSDFLGGQVHQSDFSALEPCEVRLIRAKDFSDMLSEEPLMLKYMTQLMVKENADYEARLQSLAYDSVRKRVADLLILLDNQNKDSIELSRDDLAHYTGTSKESLIRMLSEFNKDEIIKIDGQGIKILDRSKLEDAPY